MMQRCDRFIYGCNRIIGNGSHFLQWQSSIGTDRNSDFVPTEAVGTAE